MRLTDQPRGSKVAGRRRSKRKRQSSQRAGEAILNVATAVMARNGNQKFILSELARRLDISPSTIHHHFGSKEVLVAAVKARLNDPYHQSLCLPREMVAP